MSIFFVTRRPLVEPMLSVSRLLNRPQLSCQLSSSTTHFPVGRLQKQPPPQSEDVSHVSLSHFAGSAPTVVASCPNERTQARSSKLKLRVLGNLRCGIEVPL